MLKQQQSLDYCQEEVRILREVLRDEYDCKRLLLNDSQKRRLAVKAKPLGRHILGKITKTFQPDTLLQWYRDLAAKKYDSSSSGRRKSGRPRVSSEIIEQVLRMAKANPSWGYDRIRGVLAHVGLEVGRTTIKRILDDHGIVPDPEQKRRVQWKEFLSSHMHVIAATDFFCTEVMTKFGLVRYMVLFVIDISTRRVEIAGISANPDGEWMKQMARNLTDCFDGFLNGKRYLIHDRDSLFTKDFKEILKSIDVATIKLPPFSPNLNSFAERYVQTVKFEYLDKMIFTSEEQLRYVLSEFDTHYHRERPHMGLDNKIIDPWPQDEEGEIVEFRRLGGLLKSYRRVKKAA